MVIPYGFKSRLSHQCFGLASCEARPGRDSGSGFVPHLGVPSSHRVKVQRTDASADMAELADALDSGSSGGNSMQVQLLLSAPKFNSGRLDK